MAPEVQQLGTQRGVLEEQIEIVVETGRRNIAQKQDLAVLEQRAKLALDPASGKVR